MAKKPIPKREVGSPITKEEYTTAVIMQHKSLICKRDVTIGDIKLDFYFPEKEMAINYDLPEREVILEILEREDIWLSHMTPFEICGEDVEFAWQSK